MFNEINTADSQPLITKLFDFSKTCVVFITLFRWILRLHVEIHNPLFECKKKKKDVKRCFSFSLLILGQKFFSN